MNKAQRRNITSIIEELQDIQERITEILDDEQGKYDNMPEGLQSGERGETMYEIISQLESADLSGIIEALEQARDA